MPADPHNPLPAMVRKGLTKVRTGDTKVLLDVLSTLETISPNAFVGDGIATWKKTLPFMQSPRFVELADRLSYLLPLPNWHWNLQTVLWGIQQARDLPGDFIELGVFRGHTTLFCAEFVRFQTWPRKWWLYDTFDGIPDDQLDPGWEQINRQTYRHSFSYEEVAERFSPFPNIEVIKGRVPEILAGTCPDRIAFAHVDMNNAAAEVAGLDFIYDRLSPGAVVILDDFCWDAARAQFVAEVQWFRSRGLFVLALPTGQGLFIKPPA